MFRKDSFVFRAGCVLALSVLASAGACFCPRVVAAADWPQFRGPQRNGVSQEKGLLQRWPKGGPNVVWKVEGIGRGYSSASVADGRIFITGDVGDRLVVTALDLAGRVLWRAENGRAWKGPYPGARATCTVAPDGKLYHINAHGRVVCLDASSGREIWAVNVLERFDAPNIRWGISEGLLVVGDRVIVTVGGPKTLMVALDRKTGKTRWTSPPLRFMRKRKLGGARLKEPQEDCEKAGYASPILLRLAERAVIVGAAGRHVFLVDADGGELLWSTFVPAVWEVIGAAPVHTAEGVLFAAPDDFGAVFFRVTEKDGRIFVKREWASPVDNCHGCFVPVGDHLFGAGYRRFRGWAALDVASGRVLDRKTDLKKGSTAWADGRLYACGENGEMALLAFEDGRFRECGRFRLPNAKGTDIWAHPAISDGRLYLRCGDVLWCYDIRAK